jgi:hypothetical protein
MSIVFAGVSTALLAFFAFVAGSPESFFQPEWPGLLGWYRGLPEQWC